MATAGTTRNLRRELTLLLVVVAALSITSGIFETTLNNFLNDTYHISAGARGILEFPRELPGFLVAALGGLLFFLSEVRLGIFAASCVGVGLAGLAFLGDQSYGMMMVFLLTWSMGSHMMIPVTNTITLSLAEEGKRASRMGQVGAVGGATAILGSGLVALGMKYFHFSYQTLFLIACATALCAAAVVSRLQPLAHPAVAPKAWTGRIFDRLRPRRRYSLYYVLCTFSGARKQVFITFGPWVLIKVFHQPAYTIAQLWMVASAISIFFQPQLGRLIDRWGERRILMLDAVVLIAVCAGYGFAGQLHLAHPVYLLYACYVADSVMFACSMARSTYLDKIAENKSEVHAALSQGVTIDHAVSMTIPFLGGMLWDAAGYPFVFVAAAVIACGNMFAASFLRVPRRLTDEEAAVGEEEQNLAR